MSFCEFICAVCVVYRDVIIAKGMCIARPLQQQVRAPQKCRIFLFQFIHLIETTLHNKLIGRNGAFFQKELRKYDQICYKELALCSHTSNKITILKFST